ncbi:hypothetical protein [Tannerella sp.]|uniref:hypothetical protein n=1 Tax=Tannerella sp. TaxID=2382127 RepID=UPI0026DD8307|nr:hypothetical protein [Tannerella sp.]MDO4704011.1 hypothetical protein [Tannerella sp.]
MNIYEFGIGNQRKLLFFQGSCTCWKDYMPSIELLSKEFHVIVPALEGHDPTEKTDFISVEKTVGDTTDLLRFARKKSQKTQHPLDIKPCKRRTVAGNTGYGAWRAGHDASQAVLRNGNCLSESC